MAKRTFTLALWFYCGWTLGGLMTWALGTPEILGPMLGFAGAALVLAVSRSGSTEAHHAGMSRDQHHAQEGQLP